MVPPKKRRAPVQKRAEERREALLDAAAKVLDAEGIAGLTTTAVAREAEASIGTVYEYFRDKDALLDALLDRYRERLGRALSGPLSFNSLEDWEAVADSVITAFADFYLKEPGYRALWMGELTTRLSREGEAWGDEWTMELANLFKMMDDVTGEECMAIAHTCVTLVSSLLMAAVKAKKAVREARLEEAKWALKGYLRHRLPQMGHSITTSS